MQYNLHQRNKVVLQGGATKWCLVLMMWDVITFSSCVHRLLLVAMLTSYINLAAPTPLEATSLHAV